MSRPPVGATIRTKLGINLQVLEEIGDGGQGTVYRINYNGRKMALKWYHDNAFNVYETNADGTKKKDSNGNPILDNVSTAKAKELFYQNLENNIAHGSPAPQFLWPQDITEKKNGSFGYVMDLRPESYVELGTLLLAKKHRFASYQVRVDGMLNLVNAFQILHNEGYSYQDLNDGNFFFKPDTGEILICDNDNVAYAGYNSGVVGKCRFMAPEVVLQQKMPDTMTDRFSMAVILYYILFRAHPLEGASSTPACLTPSLEREIYGRNPVFVFDPVNRNNRPVHGVANHSVDLWNRMPDYLCEAFVRSFSKAASTYTVVGGKGHYQANRLTEMEWIQILARLRNYLIVCPSCKTNIIYKGKMRCGKCGYPINFERAIKLSKYNIPIRNGALLRKCQLGPCDDLEAIEPVATAFSQSGKYGILNNTNEVWHGLTSSGAPRDLGPNEAIPAIPGIKIQMKAGSFEII